MDFTVSLFFAVLTPNLDRVWMDLDFSTLHFPKTNNNFVVYSFNFKSTFQYCSITMEIVHFQ